MYKSQQLILVPYPDNGANQTATFTVDSQIPIDKIRISVGGYHSTTGIHPGIQIWSDIVNNYIGVIATDYIEVIAGVYYFSNQLQPSNGIEFVYPNKVQLAGEYNLIFTAIDGTSPAAYANPNNNDEVLILIEYYQSQ